MDRAEVGVPTWSQTTRTEPADRIRRSIVSAKFRPSAAYTQAVRTMTALSATHSSTADSPASFVAP